MQFLITYQRLQLLSLFSKLNQQDNFIYEQFSFLYMEAFNNVKSYCCQLQAMLSVILQAYIFSLPKPKLQQFLKISRKTHKMETNGK